MEAVGRFEAVGRLGWRRPAGWVVAEAVGFSAGTGRLGWVAEAGRLAGLLAAGRKRAGRERSLQG